MHTLQLTFIFQNNSRKLLAIPNTLTTVIICIETAATGIHQLVGEVVIVLIILDTIKSDNSSRIKLNTVLSTSFIAFLRTDSFGLYETVEVNNNIFQLLNGDTQKYVPPWP